MQRAAGVARAVLRGGVAGARSALDLVLPPQCPACDAITSEPGQLCAACFQAAGFITDPCCVSCGAGFASTGLGGLSLRCQDCVEQPPPWRHARAAFTYDDFSRTLILPLKYADQTENARVLGRHMARAGREILEDADLLVPVPLHRRRLFGRRYNQAALLAQQIGRVARRPVCVDALLRTRPTATLVGHSPAERAAMVAGAITLRPGRQAAIRQRRIVLVDDVLTTGATAGACAEALIAAGAGSVDVLAAARTSRDES